MHVGAGLSVSAYCCMLHVCSCVYTCAHIVHLFLKIDTLSLDFSNGAVYVALVLLFQSVSGFGYACLTCCLGEEGEAGRRGRGHGAPS